MGKELNVEEFLKDANDKQKGLLSKLVEISTKERELCGKINRVYASRGSGVHSPDGFSITICEDDDDAAIISAKDKEELEGVRRLMKGYMVEAVSLGMGNLGIIRRNYKEYVGEDVPTK